ncbi:MAG: protein BatD [Verrucomicrobia bacterium]|nr:protein BatD [Verrucomicrobiota bacterium]
MNRLEMIGKADWHRPRWTMFFVTIFAALIAVASTAAPSFTAALDRNVVPVGETVTLSLIFEGGGPGGAPQLPQIRNVAVAPGVNQSSSYTFANGQQTARQTYSYTLIAQTVGDVTIPPMAVPIGGKSVTSQPLTLKIIPTSAAAQNQANTISNLAFLRLIVPKTEVFVGEPFPVEIHLYWQNAQDIRMPQLQAEGFSMGAMPKPAQTRTQIGGTIYNLAVFKLAASAARSGDLTLGPVEDNLTVLIPITNRRQSRDPFESFFGGPQFQQRPTTITSDVVRMKVLPLPTQNVPEGFNGAIGNYQLSVTAGPTNLGVGDPITIRAKITGRGPIDSILFPAQTHWRDFNTYPPTSTVETTDELGLVGSKSFEQVVIPQNHEVNVLPPFKFSFFDTTTRSYRTLTGPTIPLSVRATGVAAPPLPTLTNSAAGEQAPVADDIVHIRPRLDDSAGSLTPLYLRPAFLGLQGIPLVLWLALLIKRKRTESLANNPRLRRQREVAQRMRDGLRDLRAHAEARRSIEFFALLFRLMQEQMGERLDLPASAITEAVIDERLRGRGMSDAGVHTLHELFQTCNAARYAPTQSSHELAALIPKLEAVLAELQKVSA